MCPIFRVEANFILMKIGEKHKELIVAAKKHGVLLRDRSSDPGCDGYVRITIGIADHVTRGLVAMGAALEEIGWQGPVAAHDVPEAREYE